MLHSQSFVSATVSETFNPAANNSEYSASELRRLLQELFPHRRLVLSQFTFYNQIGVAKPTGETFRRKRRCYRLVDILPIACVLSLKEQGIPLKNIAAVPGLIQENAARIFATGKGCRLSGAGDTVQLQMPGEEATQAALDTLLDGLCGSLFWGFDVGELAEQLYSAVARMNTLPIRQAA